MVLPHASSAGSHAVCLVVTSVLISTAGMRLSNARQLANVLATDAQP